MCCATQSPRSRLRHGRSIAGARSRSAAGRLPGATQPEALGHVARSGFDVLSGRRVSAAGVSRRCQCRRDTALRWRHAPNQQSPRAICSARPWPARRCAGLVQQRSLDPWELEHTQHGRLANRRLRRCDEYSMATNRSSRSAREGVDTLDARGALDLKVALPTPRDGTRRRAPASGRGHRCQSPDRECGPQRLVHPAAFYIGAQDRGNDYFWRAGSACHVDVIAVRPTGERVSGVARATAWSCGASGTACAARATATSRKWAAG